MKLSLFVTALAGASAVNAWAMPWAGVPAPENRPTKTHGGGYHHGPTPTPTPTPSGSPKPPHPGNGDQPKPPHKICVKQCFKERPEHCRPGYSPEKHRKCHKCCKVAGGQHPKRNLGQSFEEVEFDA